MLSWRKFLTGSQEGRLTSHLPPPSSSINPPPLSHPFPPPLKQHWPPLTQSSPPPRSWLRFFTHTFLRSLSRPVENQHVAPGHKSGSEMLTCTCPVFTSSSFPLCVTQHLHLIYSLPSLPPSLPALLTNWLSFLSRAPNIQVLLIYWAHAQKV